MSLPRRRSAVIGICTDSHSLLSPQIIERYAIEVVPLTINIDDVEYLDGVDLDADAYYAVNAAAAQSSASPTKPSSGQFALAYDRLVERGVDQIISVHTSFGVEGTLTSARLATRCSGVPVRVIDTASPSFAMSCAVWETARAVANGERLCEAITIAEQTSAGVGNLFVYEASEACRSASGHASAGLSLMSLIDDQVQVVHQVDTCSDAARAMAAGLATTAQPVNVVLAHANRCGEAMIAELHGLIGGMQNVNEIMRCRIGPSIAAYTSHCGAGMFFYPIT